MAAETVFTRITAPLQTLLKKEADQLHGDSLLYKLSLYFFTMNLVYGIINKIASISLLVTDIKTSPDAQTLGLVDASKAMYSEAFGRYDPKLFRGIFFALLGQLDFSDIPEIKSLGRFILVDGSIFPALRTMAWAAYKSTGNALKMHLAFEPDRMIPVQFISTDANGNEKEALLALLEAGVTYIAADRGYVSFEVFRLVPACRPFSSSVSKPT
ncbi:MAG: transposase [Methylovulum sp.]|nr:transposase [Methylovulum sp.]